MENKPLLFGICGFLLGGLLVAIAATTFEKPQNNEMNHASMSLADKSGDEFDKAFISEMIEHHQTAVDMAKLSASHAKHDEIKKLSEEIIKAQQKEIDQMHQWRHDWSY